MYQDDSDVSLCRHIMPRFYFFSIICLWAPRSRDQAVTVSPAYSCTAACFYRSRKGPGEHGPDTESNGAIWRYRLNH